MIGDIVYKLPKGVSLSEHIKERSIAYMDVMLGGHHYYVPITKKTKKLFRWTMHHGELEIPWEQREMVEDMFRDFINSMELQVRENVAAGVESAIMQEVRDGFDKLIRPKVEEILERRIVALSLPEKKG